MKAKHSLFVFEGPDGTGRSTLALAFTRYLNGNNFPAEFLSFPGTESGTLGKHIRDLHHDPHSAGVRLITPTSLQLLHIAAHLDTLETRIIPALEQGVTIVLDRFWWSTWVYGLVAGADKSSLRAMINLERSRWGTIKPSMIFLMIRSVEYAGQTNGPQDRIAMEYEHLATREQLRSSVRRVRNEGPLEESLSIIAHHAGLKTPGNSGGMRFAPSQRRLPIDRTQPAASLLLVFSRLAPAKTTIVYDTYWQFAAQRQAIFFQRLAGELSPWTDDPILQIHKFTNAYRASDRVSQYLIRNVVYSGDQSPQELFFRILLFKIFNRIDTWELLTHELGTLNSVEFRPEVYEKVLDGAMRAGMRVFSAAYIMPSGGRQSPPQRKHALFLKLLQRMLHDRLPLRIAEASSMTRAFDLLRGYPMIGDFLAYQYTIDLNYSSLTEFSEMEFVVAGPGAHNGLRKCFSDRGGLNESEIIKLVAERQELEFERLGLKFQSLWGRPLQLIDCQNLFCEVDKYARLRHPEFSGQNGRVRIKQKFRPTSDPITYWFPPKWGLNERISSEVVHVSGV